MLFRFAPLLLIAQLVLPASTASAQPTGTITGRVVADRDGTSVAGALVTDAETGREATTGADGRFVFADVPVGLHTVTVAHGGFVALSQQVDVTANATVTLAVRLPTTVAVTEEVTVLGRVSNYVEATAGATRSAARLIDIPQSIAVLPPRLLDDLGALETKELYRHISGVTDSPYSSTVVRGFTQREVLVNGARGNPFGSLEGDVNNSGFSTSQFRLTNIERVEVLKGPASVLYGSGEPGGVINYVTKKPRDEFEARASIGSGSFNQRLGEAEVTGAADAGKRLLYRGAIYYEEKDHFRNNAALENTHLAAGLTWRATPRATLGVEYEYVDQRLPGHRLRGIPVTADGTFLTDITWTSTEPTDFTSLEAHVAQLRWDQQLAGRLRLDSTLRAVAYDRRENYHEPRGLTADGAFMQREFRDQFRTNDDWSWSINLLAPFTVGTSSRHELALGTDVLEQDHRFRFATARQASRGGPVQNLSLTSPLYGASSAAYGLTPASFSTDTATSRRMGVYVQDLMSFGARWNLLLGGRVDSYDDEGLSGGVALAGDETAATGRAGVVFKPTTTLALYASAANGFARPGVLSQAPSANGPHGAETADQVEAGLKADLLGGQLQFTAATFRALKRNVLRPDPDLGPTGLNANAVLPTGEVRNSGLELDLAGAIRPGWDLALNYAYLRSRITSDPVTSIVGRPMPNAAPHHVGFFSRYDLTPATGVGLSLEYTAEREEPFAAIKAPAFTVVDAHLFQRLGPHLRLRVSCENLFDREYATSSLFAARAGNFPGQPRTVSVALTVSSRAGRAP